MGGGARGAKQNSNGAGVQGNGDQYSKGDYKREMVVIAGHVGGQEQREGGPNHQRERGSSYSG